LRWLLLFILIAGLITAVVLLAWDRKITVYSGAVVAIAVIAAAVAVFRTYALLPRKHDSICDTTHSTDTHYLSYIKPAEETTLRKDEGRGTAVPEFDDTQDVACYPQRNTKDTRRPYIRSPAPRPPVPRRSAKKGPVCPEGSKRAVARHVAEESKRASVCPEVLKALADSPLATCAPVDDMKQEYIDVTPAASRLAANIGHEEKGPAPPRADDEGAPPAGTFGLHADYDADAAQDHESAQGGKERAEREDEGILSQHSEEAVEDQHIPADSERIPSQHSEEAVEDQHIPADTYALLKSLAKPTDAGRGS
jgi:hypothetical protein